MYLLASSLLEHAAQLVGDLLVLRSVLAGVDGVAGLWVLSVSLALICNVYLRGSCAYLLASHLLNLIKGLVEEVLLACGVVVVVHGCVVSLMR